MTARDGQVSVVTGGSAGLGLAIALALAHAGSTVVLAGRSAERCQQAARGVTAQTGRPALGHACDVTDEDAVGGPDRPRAVRLRAAGRPGDQRGRPGARHHRRAFGGRPAGLPGGQRGGHLARLPGGRPAPCAQPAYGRILTMASALGLVGSGGPGRVRGQQGRRRPAHPQPRRRARGNRHHGERARPRAVPYPAQRRRSTTTRTVRRFLDAEVPLRRWAEPEELTGAALLLTDPQSTFLTGAVLPVDGGTAASRLRPKMTGAGTAARPTIGRMPSYEPVDLSAACNAGVDVLGE